MNTVQIANLLKNSGIEALFDGKYIYFEDPNCILSAFDKLFHYAWVATLILTAFLLVGWAFLYIRNGVTLVSFFKNTKSLMLILLIVGCVKPIVNAVYGDDLFAKHCEVQKVSMDKIQELVDQRNKKLAESDEFLLYENFNVFDTGAIYDPVEEKEDSVEVNEEE